jgi:hypothetical protein
MALAVGVITVGLAAPASATVAEGVKRYTPYAIEQIDAAQAGAERVLERVMLPPQMRLRICCKSWAA